MTLATRIAVMRAGTVEQYATPDVLYERPSTLFVAGFVGSPGMNFLSGSIVRGSAPVARIETEAIPLDGYPFCASPDEGREIVFGIRPEHVTKVAAFGDSLPVGGTLAEFEAHPLPTLNAAGHVAFGTQIAGGRATEEVFLAGTKGVQAIALAGDDAPGVPAGVLVGFDAPALNDNDLRIGGTMDKIGPAFIAALDGGLGPFAAFTGAAGHISRVASMGERLAQGELIGRFPLNAVAVAGPAGALTFATVADEKGEENAIYCRCPGPALTPAVGRGSLKLRLRARCACTFEFEPASAV